MYSALVSVGIKSCKPCIASRGHSMSLTLDIGYWTLEGKAGDGVWLGEITGSCKFPIEKLKVTGEVGFTRDFHAMKFFQLAT